MAIHILILLIVTCFYSYIKNFVLYKYTTYKNIKEIKKNYYSIPYCYKNKDYELIMKVNRKPSKVLKVLTNDYLDITKEFKRYLGPNETLITHLTPEFFGHDEIIFYFLDNSIKKFNKKDIILF